MDKKILGGRYRLDEKIGIGGMAEVYRAFDRELDRTVAVKILHPRYAGEEDFVARFRREAKAAANLNQPNIVNVYDWGSEDDTYFIVMEFLVGRNLKQIISDDGPLAPHLAIDIGRQVATAIFFAHKNGIVHRDVKPHNIMITEEGEVKVADFGIARSTTSNATQTGAILGTAHYLSPEQAKGEEVGAASDIYSLGVVLFEMVTGKVPFSGESPVAVALKHVREEPPDVRTINPAVSPALAAVIARAMAKNPADRYESAALLRDDLIRCAEGEPVKALYENADNDRTIAMPRPARPRRGAEGGRNWGRIAGLVALLLLLFAGSAAATNYFLNRMPRNEVPSLAGKTIEEAEDLAAEQKLKLKISASVYDEKSPVGRIIDQSPRGGERLPTGGTISVRLSKGKELIDVPDLRNKFQDDAMRELSRLGLNVGGIRRDFNETIAEEYVVSNDPPAGRRVTKGTYVKLLVSKGPQPLKVPYLIGKTADEARSALAAIGLVVTKEEEKNDDVEVDRVIRQDPAQGVSIERGGSVTVWVSKGPSMITVPTLKGLDQAEAKAKVEELGLKAKIQESSSEEPGFYGKVVDQSPKAEAQVRAGVTVTIWIGKEVVPPVE